MICCNCAEEKSCSRPSAYDYWIMDNVLAQLHCDVGGLKSNLKLWQLLRILKKLKKLTSWLIIQECEMRKSRKSQLFRSLWYLEVRLKN
ncbi:Peroxisome assembly protein [Trichinella pseudospiralis]